MSYLLRAAQLREEARQERIHDAAVAIDMLRSDCRAFCSGAHVRDSADLAEAMLVAAVRVWTEHHACTLDAQELREAGAIEWSEA